MTSRGLHSILTSDGYVSQSPAPHFSVPSDHAMLQQFAEFLELRLQTECLGLLRRIFADFLLEHEYTLLTFLELAATIIVIKPFEQTSARSRRRAAALLDMPKRPLHERGCVFFYLANRVHTRNIALLKMMFLEFLAHGESLIETFVARGDAVISVIPCRLAITVLPFPRSSTPRGPAVVSAGARAASLPTQPAHESTDERNIPTETAAPPHKSPALYPGTSPRSPTNLDITSLQNAAAVVYPTGKPPGGPGLRIDTTEASTMNEDTSQAHHQQEAQQQEPPRQKSSQHAIEQETTQQDMHQQSVPGEPGARTQTLEQQKPPAHQVSLSSASPKRRRVGRPKSVPTALERKPAVSTPATGAEVKVSVTDVKSELKATILDVEAEVSAAQPPKRKRGRPRKIKVGIAGQGAALSAPQQPAAGKKKRRKRGKVTLTTVRAPSKRQIRQPESFLEEQAFEVLAPKNPRRQHRGERGDASDAMVKTDGSLAKREPIGIMRKWAAHTQFDG